MVSLNIFQQDPFSTLEMTAAIEKLPYLPDGLDALGIFTDKPIRTRALMVEERDGQLKLIQTSERGSGPSTAERTTERRVARYFETKRITQGDTIFAEELQGIREFGQESVLMQVQTEVARRLAGPTGLMQNVRYTHENMRLGALQGLLLDADGSVIYNWFDEFGIVQPSTFYFDLLQGLANTLRPLCNQVRRIIARAAKGAFTPSTRLGALCGDEFYDAFVNHPDVIRTFVNWSDARDIRDGNAGEAFGSFKFGGIEWINYRGSDDDLTIKYPTTGCQFFPIGAPGIYERALAPAERFEYVNTPGKEMYVYPIFDKDRNEWWRAEVYSYPLFICKRPDLLFTGSMSAVPIIGGSSAESGLGD